MEHTLGVVLSGVNSCVEMEWGLHGDEPAQCIAGGSSAGRAQERLQGRGRRFPAAPRQLREDHLGCCRVRNKVRLF